MNLNKWTLKERYKESHTMQECMDFRFEFLKIKHEIRLSSLQKS